MSRNRRAGRAEKLSILGLLIAILFAVSVQPATAGEPSLPNYEWWLRSFGIQDAQLAGPDGAGITVAVIDGGVVDTIGDLNGRVLPGRVISGGGTAHTDDHPYCQSDGCFSHGTDMAVLIAGTGDGAGMLGVAPRAKILPVKVSAGTDADVDDQPLADGIRYAVQARARVISISLGAEDDPCDDPVASAVDYAYHHDVIVVASAGNEKHAVENPANCPGVLAITAIAPNHRAWSDNSHGRQVAFATAGADTVAESVTGTGIYGGDGTSDATAIAAGMFALLRSAYPDETARQIVARVLWNTSGGCARPGGFINDEIGYGVIDVYDSMTKAPPPSALNPIYDAWALELGPVLDTDPEPTSQPRGGDQISPCPAIHRVKAAAGTIGRISGTAATDGVAVITIVLTALFFRRRGRRRARG